jgi:RNA polymerase sigma factor (sigma-70 family)
MTGPEGYGRSGDAEETSSGDLVRECGQKLTDPALWQRFQDRFHRPIMTYVVRVMWNRFRKDSIEDAGDLVQEVYLRLVRNNGRLLRSFKGQTDFSVKAFLSRIAMSVVSDHYRSQLAGKRKPAEVISIEHARHRDEDPPGSAVEINIPAVLSAIDVERLIEAESDRKNVMRNVLIFKLHYVDRFTVKEIAQFPGFGLKESAIDLILQNLRTSLRKRMGL